MIKPSTQDLLSMQESDFVSRLKTMPTEELEQHAESLIHELGGDDYPGIMKQVMRILETPDTRSAELFTRLQNELRDLFPNKAHMSDIYQRLASLLMLILMRKYQTILGTKQ